MGAEILIKSLQKPAELAVSQDLSQKNDKVIKKWLMMALCKWDNASFYYLESRSKKFFLWIEP